MQYSKAEKHLISIDPVLGQLIKKHRPLVDRPQRSDYFASLTRSIIGQQISVKSASRIFERFGKITKLDPSKVASMNDDQVSLIGLSGPKRRYLQDLAEHFVKDSEVFNHLAKLSNDEVIDELTRVKGIGVWTAQMFLIFTLARQDVFAADDRGLQIAIENNYNLSRPTSRAQLDELAETWSPHRTTASLYLWQSLQNTPD
jgi:DNA-3-methyladenine glycosylase II